MTDATFTTTCARCAAPLEVTDATIDAVSKAHEARCFLRGDYVRFTAPAEPQNTVDGEIVGINGLGVSCIKVRATSGYDGAPPIGDSCGFESNDGKSGYPDGTIRRIPRPDPVVAPKWAPTEGYPRQVAKLHDHLVGYLATTKPAPPDSETSFACPACGRAYDGSDESSVAHRKGCGQYDAYVAWLAKPADRRGLDVEHPVTPTPTARRDPAPPDSETERETFVPGDVAEWRLDGLTWERVTVVRAYPGDKFEIEHHRTVERWQVHRSEMRSVAREERATDPLDVEYDGVTLRVLLDLDRGWRDETRFVGPGGPGRALTPAQRAAVSAHWSAQLRARLSASSERARLTVVNEQDCEDE